MLRNPEDPGWPEQGERTELGDVAEAWAWAYYATVQREHRDRAFGLGPPSRPLAAEAEAYLKTRSYTVEPATWRSDKTAMGHLLRWASADTTTSNLAARDLEGLFRSLLEQGYQPSTLRTYRISLRVFLASLDRAHLLDGVVIPDRGKIDVRSLGSEDIRRLRAAAIRIDEQRIGRFPSARYAVELGLSLGLRQGEIFALRWEDFRPEYRSVRVQRQTPKDSGAVKPLKSKHGRTVLVLPGWWEIHTGGIGLIVGRGGETVGSRTQRNLITRILDTAGLNEMGMGWHVLRHTYSRLCMEEHGVSLEELQRFLGHSSIRTTETTYGHFRPDVAVERAARKVYG